MIEEAIVDCHGEEEQHEGLLVALEEHLACPFAALVVGQEVTVIGLDRDPPGEIVARCVRADREHRINVTALEWAADPPGGAEWIDAYRAWLAGEW
jgi:hypothetical protein